MAPLHNLIHPVFDTVFETCKEKTKCDPYTGKKKKSIEASWGEPGNELKEDFNLFHICSRPKGNRVQRP